MKVKISKSKKYFLKVLTGKIPQNVIAFSKEPWEEQLFEILHPYAWSRSNVKTEQNKIVKIPKLEVLVLKKKPANKQETQGLWWSAWQDGRQWPHKTGWQRVRSTFYSKTCRFRDTRLLKIGNVPNDPTMTLST